MRVGLIKFLPVVLSLCGLFAVVSCAADAGGWDTDSAMPRSDASAFIAPAGPTEVSGQSIEPTPAATAEPSAEDWLTFLEASAGELQNLTARVTMTKVADLLDETSQRFGNLVYDAADEDHRAVRFAVRFDVLKIDDLIEKIDQAYIFDGRWLLDLDEKDRTASRRELVPEGEIADLDLGDGPFLIPLNLKKDRLLRRFEVELVPAATDDPAADAGSFHLRLTPRPGIESQAEVLDLWFDRETLLPLRAASLQDDGDQTTIDLTELQPNAGHDDGVFDTQLPTGKGWQTQVVPLN